MEKYDTDQDGAWSESEWKLYEKNQQLEATIRKQARQGAMAWAALIAMFVFTAALFMPGLSIERLDSLTTMSDFFYIAQAGIVGAFVGVSTWISNR